MGMLGDLLSGAGYVLDTPGSLLRGGIANLGDAVSGQNRFRGFRATGREMLDSLGVGGGYAGGLAADLLVDPLNMLGGAALLKSGGKLAKGVASGTSKLSTALRPSKSTAMALGAPTAGFGVLAMNEDQDPGLSLLGTALMMSPLAVGMAKGVGKLAAGKKASDAGAKSARVVKQADAPAGTPKETPASYLSIGHDASTNPEMFAFVNGKLDVRPAPSGKMHSDVFGSDLTSAQQAVAGRIDHAKRQISLTSIGSPSPRSMEAAAKRLASKYPDYDIYDFDDYFNASSPGGTRPSPRLMSLLPWLAAGGGATGSALTHWLAPQPDAA